MAEILAPLAVRPGLCPGGWVLHVYAGRTGQGGGRLVMETTVEDLDNVEDQALADADYALAALEPGEGLAVLAYDGDTGMLGGLFRLEPGEW